MDRLLSVQRAVPGSDQDSAISLAYKPESPSVFVHKNPISQLLILFSDCSASHLTMAKR